MRREYRPLKEPLQWFTIFAIALLLGLGCCGLNVHLLRTSAHDEYFTVWGVLGGALILLSPIGIVVSGLILLARVIHNRSVGE